MLECLHEHPSVIIKHESACWQRVPSNDTCLVPSMPCPYTTGQLYMSYTLYIITHTCLT